MSFPGLRSPSNPIIFFDLHSDADLLGRLEFELFADTCPKLAEAFRKCCVGEVLSKTGRPLGYKNAQVSKISDQYFVADSPDWQEIEGIEQDFNEGKTEVTEKGSIGLMMEASKTEFFVLLDRCDWLNGVLPCIGKVYGQGKEIFRVLEVIRNATTLPGGRPKFEVRVGECGEY